MAWKEMYGAAVYRPPRNQSNDPSEQAFETFIEGVNKLANNNLDLIDGVHKLATANAVLMERVEQLAARLTSTLDKLDAAEKENAPPDNGGSSQFSYHGG